MAGLGSVILLIAALLAGVVSKPHINGCVPKIIGRAGGAEMTITGVDFNLEPFGLLDDTSTNRNVVTLNNTIEAINCKVVAYKSNTEKIVCIIEPRIGRRGSNRFEVNVRFGDEEATGYQVVKIAGRMNYVTRITPSKMVAGGGLVKIEGKFLTTKYRILNVSNPSSTAHGEDDISKVYVSGDDCEMINPQTENFYAIPTKNQITCYMKSKRVGPGIASLLSGIGKSQTTRDGMKSNKNWELGQIHTYPVVDNVSPNKGSPIGDTLITVTGSGFNPDQDIKVFVGGATCNIQSIEYQKITCLTPPEDLTYPGSRERGYLWEFFDGVEGDSPDIMATMDKSHLNYTSEVKDGSFNVEVTNPSFGRISGFIQQPHDAECLINLYAKNAKTFYYIGNPDHKKKVKPWEKLTIPAATPIYFMFPVRLTESTEVKLMIFTYNSNHTEDESLEDYSEKQSIKMKNNVVNDIQRLTPNLTTSTSSLTAFRFYINGHYSSLVDMTDVEKVREALLSMAEQQCEIQGVDPNTKEQSDFETQGSTPPGKKGTIVDDTEPFCGRCVFQPGESVPLIYSQTIRTEMIDLTIFPYVCFAVKGSILDYMRIRIEWKDKTGKTRNSEIVFKHNFTADANTWSFKCHNLMAVVENSKFNGDRHDDDKPLLSAVYSPNADTSDYFGVFVDHFSFSDLDFHVIQTQPSAYKQNNVLIRDIIVSPVMVDNKECLDVTFVTSNCHGNLPLLAVTNSYGDHPGETSLLDRDSQTYLLDGVNMMVYRIEAGTDREEERWSLQMEEEIIKGIPLYVSARELKSTLETELGVSGLRVLRSGDCYEREWTIEWLKEPGNQPIITVDTNNDRVTATTHKLRKGRNKKRLEGDLVSVYRKEPSISVTVDDHKAVTRGNSDFTFSLESVPTVTLITLTDPETRSTTDKINIRGTGFISFALTDYAVFIGPSKCEVTEVTTTSINCTVDHLPAGIYSIRLALHPYGGAPPSSLTIEPNITKISPSSGSTGGGYLLKVTGLRFPPDLGGWSGNTVYVGGAECILLAADRDSVTCIVPAGAVGTVDVSVLISGSTDIFESFTYDDSSVAVIDSVIPIESNVLGGEILTITGTGFGNGSNGYVKVGSEDCFVDIWTNYQIKCMLPANGPGQHAISVSIGEYTKGFATGSGNMQEALLVEYILKITAPPSPASGSVNGGTLLAINGEGFGSNCSRLKVDIGERMTCDIKECSDTHISCVTRRIYKTHVINNTGSAERLGIGTATKPSKIDIEEGDYIKLIWKSSLRTPMNFFQTVNASSNAYDGYGLYSGEPTYKGSKTEQFLKAGAYTYSSNTMPVSYYDVLNMKGIINVKPVDEENNKITVKLDGREAVYEHGSSSPSVSVEDCSTLLRSPLEGCNFIDPDPPFFKTTPCLTPTITGVAANATESIFQSKEIQVRAGVNLTISGKGFGNEICQTNVKIGSAVCNVTATSDTSVTCVLNDFDRIVPLKSSPVSVTVGNRGSSRYHIHCESGDYKCGQLIVIPVVSSIVPQEGSTNGGTLINITGSGLKALDGKASVTLGSGSCLIENVTSTTIQCRTEAAQASNVNVGVYISANNVPAISEIDGLTYEYKASATPSVAKMTQDNYILTVIGSFCDSFSKILITLADEGDISERTLLFSTKKKKTETAIDEEMLFGEKDGYTAKKERQETFHEGHTKTQSNLIDDLDFGTDFWEKFTNAKAKNYEESKKLGNWKIAGSKPRESELHLVIDNRVEPVSNKLRESNTYVCPTSFVNRSHALCSLSGIPAGIYRIAVSVDGCGDAVISDVIDTVTVLSLITNISPSKGSTNGGALLTISGYGFTPGKVTVLLDDAECPLEREMSNSLSCRVPPHTLGSCTVNVTSNGVSVTTKMFTYSTTETPDMISVSPASGLTPGTTLTLNGANFGNNPIVFVGGKLCIIISSSDTTVDCVSPDLTGGSHSVKVRHSLYGDSKELTVEYLFEISSVEPSEGGFGGTPITIFGNGFDPDAPPIVTICDSLCPVDSFSSSSISCTVPPYTGDGTNMTCDVEITNDIASTRASQVSIGSFNYNKQLTPVITKVLPKRGGTAGGTTLTITGSGFRQSGNKVIIDGSPCIISKSSASEIKCVTEAHKGAGEFQVIVNVPGKGKATSNEGNAIFYYIDLWSSRFTWEGLPPPVKGDIVEITKNQTILLDVSTDVIKAIIINGGHLIFDDETCSGQGLHLRAEYIVIVDNGSLSIGSESEPFLCEAIITLYGNALSPQLPLFGNKVIAVRKGTLDIHGKHLNHTWTKLAKTAKSGDRDIVVQVFLPCKPGDVIIIASTGDRYKYNENDKRKIKSISKDGKTLTLTEPLAYDHICITQTIAGRQIETCAEVGLLTRNVKILGDIIHEDNAPLTRNAQIRMNSTSQKCELHNTDQFAVQECRLKENNNHGAHVMLDSKLGGDVFGRFSYAELRNVGQAYQLGRYPIHYHMSGDVNGSFVRGCSVHGSSNRAITIHGVHNLLVERNVVYDIQGHAIFLEDGIEEENIIRYNLAIGIQRSSSLLNVDTTPAAFWVVNPNNIIEHNVAAGISHFGFWFKFDEHPSGPSATTKVCPNKIKLGSFKYNTAHSIGRYALWVFSNVRYVPENKSCSENDRKDMATDFTRDAVNPVARFYNFFTWRCERAAEAVFAGRIQFVNFIAMDHEKAAFEMVDITGVFGENSGSGIFHSLVIGHSALSNGSCGSRTRGIVAPKRDIFNIGNVTFVNFNTSTCTALSGCSQCKKDQGSCRIQTANLTFLNSPNRLIFKWLYESIWIDTDGSLTGNVKDGKGERIVIPTMDILPTAKCQMDVAGFSGNPEATGAVCSGLRFVRFRVLGTNISPSSLQAKDIILTSSSNNKSIRIPFSHERLSDDDERGWMTILFTSGEIYDMKFDAPPTISSISYDALTQHIESGDSYMMRHTFLEKPHLFSTTGIPQNSVEGTLDPIVNKHGDYSWNDATGQMTYIVVGPENSNKNIFENHPLGSDAEIKFRSDRCSHKDCGSPTPPPVPTDRPNDISKWSDLSTWGKVPEGTGGNLGNGSIRFPIEYDDIIIPLGMNLLIDTVIPKLGKMYVYGTVEFEDGMDHTLEIYSLVIKGGSVGAGFSSDNPFTSNLNIILAGPVYSDDGMLLPESVPSIGSRAIGVFGQLSLHGKHTGKTWVKLGATASVDDTNIMLAEAIDSTWLNKEIMITTTGKEAKESEIRTVTAINGVTLTLDKPLVYGHLGVSYTLSDGSNTFTMAAEVGLFSRNIRIEGKHDNNIGTESVGGRILVSKFRDDIDNKGMLKMYGVELKNMGQLDFTDPADPRYAVAFYGIGVDDGTNYVKRCSFDTNYNTAIGLLGSGNITIEENVIYTCVGPCIQDDSSGNVYRKNLLSVMLFTGTYNGRNEELNKDFYGAFSLNKATGFVLDGNVVAGSELAGYQTFGETCEDETLWTNNEVHSALMGVMVRQYGPSSPCSKCRRVTNTYAWRIWDTAVFVLHCSSFFVSEVHVLDSKVGVIQIIYGPTSLSHKYSDKTTTVTNSTFVGATPYHTCEYQKSKAAVHEFYADRLWFGGRNGTKEPGNSGVVHSGFVSTIVDIHEFSSIVHYPALHGGSIIDNVLFSDYNTRDCGDDVAMVTNPTADDATHPIETSRISMMNTPVENYIYFNKPRQQKVNPADCGNMHCDGHKKVILTDKDGTLLGKKGATLTSQAEYGYNSNSSGVGDDVVPLFSRLNPDGTIVDPSKKYPNKGIIRDSTCTYMEAWRAWLCEDLKHRMLIIESMDSDTEVRRLAPIGIIANGDDDNGYVDILNGPQDTGWCAGYTCQERISTFFSVIATNNSYEISMTSSPPQVLRFHLLHADPGETVLLNIILPKSERHDVYVDNVYVKPTNLNSSLDSSYKLLSPSEDDPSEFTPTLSDPVGTNYDERETWKLIVVMGGRNIIDIKTIPTITLSTNILINEEEFFEEDVVQQIADMLGVSPENVRITSIVREDSAKRNGLTPFNILFEASNPPTMRVEGGDLVTRGEFLKYDDFIDSQSNFVDAFQSGNTNLAITEVTIQQVQEPTETPGPHADEHFGTQLGKELYNERQQAQEAHRLKQSLTAEVYAKPKYMTVNQGVPTSVVALTRFSYHPQISVVSEENEVIEYLGYKFSPWKIKASITSGSKLVGSSTVPYVNGMANFKDLLVNSPGQGYKIAFSIDYPNNAPKLSVSLNYTFSASPKSASLKIVSFPKFINKKKKFSLDLVLVDDDTDKRMDPFVLSGQKLVGTITMIKTSYSKIGDLKGRTSFTISDGDISKFTIDNLFITDRGTDYMLKVQASIVPADINVSVTSGAFDILHEDLIIPTNGAIVKDIQMEGLRNKNKVVKGKEKFASMMKAKLKEKIPTAYFYDSRVIFKKRPTFYVKVTGSKDDVDKAIDELCRYVKWKNFGIKISGRWYKMGYLRVDGNKVTCKK